MAVAVIMDFSGATLDQYDEVIEKMDLGGRVPENAHFHWVAPADDGMRVVDVWETPDHFQAFFESRLAPAVQEHGLPGEPEVVWVELHNHFDTAAG